MNLLLPVSTQRVAAAQAEDQDNGLAHKKRKLLNQFQGNLEANQKTESKTLKEVHHSIYSLIFIVIAQKRNLIKKTKSVSVPKRKNLSLQFRRKMIVIQHKTHCNWYCRTLKERITDLSLD